MKKRIKGKLCDTESATKLGAKCEGEFGDPSGYEEQLFVTKTQQYFLYGVGGAESKYAEPAIELLTDEQAEAWKKENGIEEPKAAGKAKKAAKSKKTGTTKKSAKPKQAKKN